MAQEMETTAPKKGRKSPATHEQKRKRRKLIQRCIALIVAVGILGGGGYALKRFVFTDKTSEKGEPMVAEVYLGSIQSKVEGSGTARAKNAAVVTPESGYTVLQLLVSEGDQVEAGQLLYNLDDATARDALETAKDNVRKAEEGVRSAQEGVNTAREQVRTAQEGVRTAQERVGTAQEEVADAQEQILKAQENVATAQEEADRRQRALDDLRGELVELTTTAPHAGKLLEVNQSIKEGKQLAAGDAIATVFNDTKLRLRLYYSWAYENQIQPGQAARITLPASMADYPGVVEKVNYVKRVLPEGSIAFEVVFVLDNPGTLTDGTTASAQLTAADGSAIYPYADSTLEYYETTVLTAKKSGPVEYAELMNYAAVTSGQVLVRQGDKDMQEEITTAEDNLRSAQRSVDEAKRGVEDAQKAAEKAPKGIEEAQRGVEEAERGVVEAQKGVEEAQRGVETAQKGVTDAQKGVEEAQKKLDNYHATAPIAGTVLSVGGLLSGEEVPSGAAIQIADTSVMAVDINIDERNIGFVKNGMMVDLQDSMENYYMGTVDQIALSAKAENGVAAFPAVVTVENPDGVLKPNTYVNYSFIASQSDNCLVVPLQAVMNVTLSDGGENPSIPGSDVEGKPITDGSEDGTQGEPVSIDPESGTEGEPVSIDPESGTEGESVSTDPESDAESDTSDTSDTEGEPISVAPEDGIEGEPTADGEHVTDLEGGAQRKRLAAVAVQSVDMGFSSSIGPNAFNQSGTSTVCFVKGEPDDRAIEADPTWDIPEGFFAVVVKTGLSDTANVEIVSGLHEGDQVFIGYETTEAYA